MGLPTAECLEFGGNGSIADAKEIHASGVYPHRPVQRYLRDAHHSFAPAGTPDVQLLRLGEVALGLSKGQWSEQLAAPVQGAARPLASR